MRGGGSPAHMALLAEGRALAWMAVRVMVELHSFEEPHAREGRSLDGLCEVGKGPIGRGGAGCVVHNSVWPSREGKDGVVCSGDSKIMGGSWREGGCGPLIRQLVPSNARVGLDLAQVGREAEGAAGYEVFSEQVAVFALPQRCG